MSDVAAQIDREAKALHAGLKELLKTRDIHDKEIEIQRKNLRRLYLRLLLVHPYAKESRDAETHLWMQTSYSLISIYKQRIASLDRAIQNPPRQPQQGAHQQRVVEYRKVLQRFRQFLSDEEKFWTQLIVRFRRNFGVDAAQPALTALKILPETEPPPPNAENATSPRRNQYQFPPESDNPDTTPPAVTAAQRESRLAILSKALVCLGDIARYKEQYNDSHGRPRAGHEDGPPAAPAKPSRKKGAPPPPPELQVARLRNYERAQQCYEQARSLVPHDGNPSHQLAILSSYQRDMFNSLVHYYRALCVRQPYDPASENMGTILGKALERWKAHHTEDGEEPAQAHSITPRLRVDAFREKVVVLHAQWRLNVPDEDDVANKIIDDFQSLVSERVLPIDMISKIIILSHGALWKHRMVRQASNGEKKFRFESRIASHLVALHGVLLNIGCHELLEVPPEDAGENDLAQHITATFRRTLPALRMAGKWVRANTRYLAQAAGTFPVAAQAKPRGRDRQPVSSKDRLSNGPTVTIDGLDDFWAEYVTFANTLVTSFPPDRLPALIAPLEEDLEVVGFLPLRKYMLGESKVNLNGHQGNTSEPVVPTELTGLHPNEEQLMRISDMLIDAKAVAIDENTPVVFENAIFEVRKRPIVQSMTTDPRAHDSQMSLITAVPQAASVLGEYLQQSDPDDDNSTIATRTDDDPVGDAFREVLGAPENDDDEIVWDPTPLRSPREVATLPQGYTTPQRLSPTSPKSPKSPTYSPHREKPSQSSLTGLEHNRQRMAPTTPPMTAGITAAELLSNMMGPQRSSTQQPPFHHARMASAPTAPISFGPNGPVQSIWSDDSTRQYPTSSTISNPIPNPLVGTSPHQVPAQNGLAYAQGNWPNQPPNQMPSQPFLPSSPTTVYNSQSSAAHFSPPGAPNFLTSHHDMVIDTAFQTQGTGYPSQVGHRRYDSLRSSLPIGDRVNVPTREPNQIPPSAYPDTIYSASPGSLYSTRDNRNHYGHVPQSRSLNVDRSFTAPFISSSSIWGHPG